MVTGKFAVYPRDCLGLGHPVHAVDRPVTFDAAGPPRSTRPGRRPTGRTAPDPASFDRLGRTAGIGTGDSQINNESRTGRKYQPSSSSSLSRKRYGMGSLAPAAGRQGVTGPADQDDDFDAEHMVGTDRFMGLDIQIEASTAPSTSRPGASVRGSWARFSVKTPTGQNRCSAWSSIAGRPRR